MEFLFLVIPVLIVLIGFFIGIPIWVGVLSNDVYKLRKRIDKLQSDKKSIAEQPAEQQRKAEYTQERPDSVELSQPEQSLQQEAVPSTPQKESPESAVEKEASEPSALKNLGQWLKEDWLMKLGGLLILIAVGWFVSYAFIHNWIGEIGRITLGLVGGAAVLGFASWCMRRHINQGGVLLLVGSGIVILTVWAARFMYDFFTPATALGIMFLAVMLATVSSVIHRSYWVTAANVILASVVPLLTSTAEPDLVMLFIYLLVVVAGSIWVVAMTGWRSLSMLALIVVALYSAPIWLDIINNIDQNVLLFISFIFTAIFFVANILGVIRGKGRAAVIDLAVAACTGIFVMLWVVTTAPEVWQSIMLAAWMLVFGIGAFATFRLTGEKKPMLVYAAVALMLLAAGTAVELGGAALVIAYTIEAGALSLVAYPVLKDIRIAEYISFVFAAPILLSLGSIDESVWNESIIHEHFFVLLIMMLALATVGAFFLIQRFRKSSEALENGMIGNVWLIVSSLYLFTLIWLVSHAATTSSDLAIGISLTLYTLLGLATYIVAGVKQITWIRVYGGIILGAVVLRLLIVDVWNMELAGRIITFFLIGILLMTSAFIGRNDKNADEE